MLEELRHEADAPVVKAKIFNKEAIVIYGSSAAKIFYDPRNFKRKGAMPKLVLKTLLVKVEYRLWMELPIIIGKIFLWI